MSESYGLLVLGGGPAGLAAVRAYRDAGGSGGVAIVADEHRVPYERPPLTKELLRGQITEIELPIEPDPWYAERGIALIAGRAVDLDADARRVTLSGARTLHYGHAVLATGAEPARLPVPGADDPSVRVLRSLDHLRELNARLSRGAPVAVIGSGFIGCEIAASLRHRGQPVTVISDEAAPNVNRLGTRAAAVIAAWLGDDGVTVRSGHAVRAIERDGDTLTVVTDATRTEASVVMMAVGVAPRAELAAAAGLELSDGAIPVDASMRTGTPRLLAAGDVCLAENASAGRPLRVEHWGEALAQGAVAGRTAAGEPAQWDDVPGFWSTIGERTLKYAAWGDGFDEVAYREHDDGAFVVRYGRAGRLVGVLTHGYDAAYDGAAAAIAGGAAWTA